LPSLSEGHITRAIRLTLFAKIPLSAELRIARKRYAQCYDDRNDRQK